MKKQLLALFLAALMIFGLLPISAFAAVDGTFDSFFADFAEAVTFTNDGTYPYTGAERESGVFSLVSTNTGKGNSSSAITVTFQKTAKLTFDYEISSEARFDGLLVKNGSTVLYTYSASDASGAVTGCSGNVSGSAAVTAKAGDVVTIAYRKDSSGNGGSDCMWVKNFAVSLPNTVTLHAADGTERTAEQGIFGTDFLQANPFSREGYRFKGWAANEADAQSGQVTYADGAKITLTQNMDLYAVWANVYTLTVNAQPTDAVLHVSVSGNPNETILPETEGGNTYLVENGSYDVTASAFGYLENKKTIEIAGADKIEEFTLAKAPGTALVFVLSYADSPAAAPVPNIEVKWGDTLLSPEEDGSYLLPSGTYTYAIKAKGYAKETGEIIVSATPESKTEKQITLLPSTAWDGTTKTQPAVGDGTKTSPYQIEDGEMLSWFAQEVNAKTANAGLSAILTADIDLGGNPFTPIGTSYSSYYSGTFDGKGFAVKNLSVNATSGYAGLFGYVKGTSSANLAVIQNLTVEGSVTASGSYIAGIAGYAANSKLENVHNKALVTANDGARYIGGIVGKLDGELAASSNSAEITGNGTVQYVGGVAGQGYGGKVLQSFNSGEVLAENGQYVGGIFGELYAAGNDADVYNTGKITGSSHVGGIVGFLRTNIKNGYNTGDVIGSTNVGAIIGLKGSASKTAENFLSLISDDLAASTVVSAEALVKNGSSMLGANWKNNEKGTTNSKYPLLLWQTVVEDSTGAPDEHKLAAPKVTWTVENPGSSSPTVTPIALWNGVENAASYEVEVVCEKVIETGNITTYEYETVEKVTLPADAEKTEYSHDFSALFAAGTNLAGVDLPSGWYYARVSAKPAAESEFTASDPSALDWGYYAYMTELSAPTGLVFQGSNARFDAVDFAYAYQVSLYRLPAEEKSEPHYIGGAIVTENFLDCSRSVSAGSRYVFTVTALSEGYAGGDETAPVSPVSRFSNDASEGGEAHGIYTPGEGAAKPDPSEFTEITTAEQLIDIAAAEDRIVDAGTGMTEQDVMWSKNYRLTKDLDFSALSPAYSAKSKTIGNVLHPFTGIFDGNGHKITGLTLSGTDAGLFGAIGAVGVLKNLTIEGANVLFSDNAGVLTYANKGTIRNCAVKNTNITADVGAVLGGFVSRNYGLIEECYVFGGTLKSNSDRATGHAGFAGSNEEGGIIRRCYSTMKVETASKYAGGFVGLCYGGEITDCFAKGDVSAASNSGGFAGSVVYAGNVFANCYASNAVTTADNNATAYGFVSVRTADSAFQIDLSKEGFSNCYFHTDKTQSDTSGASVIGANTQTLKTLQPIFGLNWRSDEAQNGGLPYLATLPAPTETVKKTLTVTLMSAVYDRENYGFMCGVDPLSVTLESGENTRLIDVMDAAKEQGLLDYAYSSGDYGRYIVSIGGYEVKSPDGWMFTVNDALSPVSASLASVKDGDQILWFEGTTQNLYTPPLWNDVLNGTNPVYVDIGTKEELLALAASGADLSANYRLTADIDLAGVNFAGIGSLSAPFTGTFDGKGHVIKNFRMAGTANVGFFNVILGAKIQNIRLQEVDVSGEKNVGALVGYAKASLSATTPGDNRANLIGSSAVESGSVSGHQNVGGLVGVNEGLYDSKTGFSIYSAVDASRANVTVTGLGSGTDDYTVGGFVGKNSGYITASSAFGETSGNTSVGGFAGRSDGGIYDCAANGKVSGKATVGGFVGMSSGALKNAYSTGAVTGSERTGGFAGTISAAENVISTGSVTVAEGSLVGYNGGFAGELSGTLAGNSGYVSIKNAFANCILLSPIGNAMSYPGESNAAALAAMALSSNTSVCDKLYELFSVNLPGSALSTEAGKLLEVVNVSYNEAVGEAISLVKSGETLTAQLTLTKNDPDNYLSIEGGAVKLLAKNETGKPISIPITVRLSDAGGSYYQTLSIRLLPKTADAEKLMNAIAATYMENSSEWVMMDMAAYSALFPSSPIKTSAAARQKYINYAIGTVQDYTTGASSEFSTYAKAEIILRAIGGDTEKLYPRSSTYPISNAARLRALSVTSYYDAPWMLLANIQGNLHLTDSQIDALIALIAAAQPEDGVFGYSYGGVNYPDPDTTATILSALAPYQSRAAAKSVIDKGVEGLSLLQGADGTFGSANSDAMVILALVSMGIDPSSDARFVKNGISLSAALLSYANSAGDGFTYYGHNNALATEQGFRALIAMAQFNAKKTAFQIYDFSGEKAAPLYATEEGSITPPSEPDGDKTITVSFALKAKDGYWIPTETLSITEGSTVYHALIKGLGNDFTQKGAESGYVSSITNKKTGETLSEFDGGSNAGWLYTVNGKAPSQSLTEYVLHEGDTILWYYTSDWTSDPNTGVSDGDSTKEYVSTVEKQSDGTLKVTIKKDGKPVDSVKGGVRVTLPLSVSEGEVLVLVTESGEKIIRKFKRAGDQTEALLPGSGILKIRENARDFADVLPGSWYEKAVTFASARELFSGISESEFAPDLSMSRGMLVTVLHRLEDEVKAEGGSTFDDVSADSFYADAVSWALSLGIVNGVSDKEFAPNAPITREELAVMLYRYAKKMGADVTATGNLLSFKDSGNVSSFAREAMRFAVGAGIITGKEDNMLDPRGSCTRAEVAIMLQRLIPLLFK